MLSNSKSNGSATKSDKIVLGSCNISSYRARINSKEDWEPLQACLRVCIEHICTRKGGNRNPK